MIATLLVAGALAGGGGLYTDFQWGASRADTLGFIARGNAMQWGLGGYWGNYSGSFRYGTYWHGGLLLRVRQIFLIEQDNDVDVTIAGGIRFGRGVDLIKVGAWWSVAAGPAFSYSADSLREALDMETAEPTPGVFVRFAVGGAYYLAPWVAVEARFEPGLQFNANQTSYIGGFGFGLRFRVPVIRRHWEEEESDDSTGTQ